MALLNVLNVGNVLKMPIVGLLDLVFGEIVDFLVVFVPVNFGNTLENCSPRFFLKFILGHYRSMIVFAQNFFPCSILHLKKGEKGNRQKGNREPQRDHEKD